ncbi:MAG: tautomerase family protein [Rickettsiaceae bacterium]|nr:tautomerase family protein [Rickettsiaceae bacterium]
MPLINIQMKSGRTLEQKRKLVAEVTKVVCETIDAKPEKVRIVLSDLEPESHAVGGVLSVDKD